MTSPALFPPPAVPLRVRVARAVCARHSTGNQPVCEMGQQMTDDVLAEVQAWLLEAADRREAEYAPGSDLAFVAAGDVGTMRGLASAIAEGLPGEEQYRG